MLIVIVSFFLFLFVSVKEQWCRGGGRQEWREQQKEESRKQDCMSGLTFILMGFLFLKIMYRTRATKKKTREYAKANFD